MQPLRIVVVAASAGGVAALRELTAGLPADLPATVLLALHFKPDAPSLLATILDRHCPLPCAPARDGAALQPGTVVVAPPDRHLLVLDGRVVLGDGPTEHGHRPGHDVMMLSAALAARERAVGVVLTGLLDDGARGLAGIVRYGGAALVQDPTGAEYPSMPHAALAAVPDAVRRPVDQLARAIVAAVGADRAAVVVGSQDLERDEEELRRARGHDRAG